jgi:transketolase
MGAVMNGIALHGGTRVYGGTFLVFSDYMRGAVRLAALMGLPVTYVWTHDSIGLGEDGPTHQPIEHLASAARHPRPGRRPAGRRQRDRGGLAHHPRDDRPAGRHLPDPAERPDLRPAPSSARPRAPPAAATSCVTPATARRRSILMGTGSEVQICVAAQEALEAEGIPTGSVSMPCVEWFRRRTSRTSALSCRATCSPRVGEAAVSQAGTSGSAVAGECVALEHFGASAPYTVLYEQFGLTDRPAWSPPRAPRCPSSASPRTPA